MAKYKLAGGFAITPEREIKLFKEMSNKGWHLTGMKGSLLYLFEKGEPYSYDYALNFEDEIDQDMLAYYEASGWSPVIIIYGIQVFRAKAGTTPIFSDQESQIEVLEKNWRFCGKWASIFGIMLFIWFWISNIFDLGLVTMGVMIALFTCFVFTFFPFVGFTRSLKRLQQK